MFPGIPSLLRAILEYVQAHKDEGKPIKWSKAADQILDKIKRFGQRTAELHGEQR